ncbi:unnamed protein product [Blepharisma stoltei]|uniref:Uncharacterized protein n=1 Tax=Blepharisma stoltei TaxID=1481888 RepID=A0AAU9K1C5_9CILI|nr:unnamed protein product [Blepharisma stoltei]
MKRLLFLCLIILKISWASISRIAIVSSRQYISNSLVTQSLSTIQASSYWSFSCFYHQITSITSSTFYNIYSIHVTDSTTILIQLSRNKSAFQHIVALGSASQTLSVDVAENLEDWFLINFVVSWTGVAQKNDLLLKVTSLSTGDTWYNSITGLTNGVVTSLSGSNYKIDFGDSDFTSTNWALIYDMMYFNDSYYTNLTGSSNTTISTTNCPSDSSQSISLSSPLSIAIQNSEYSVQLPFSISDYSYELSCTISLTSPSDGSASCTNGLFTISNPTSAGTYTFSSSCSSVIRSSVVSISIASTALLAISAFTTHSYSLNSLAKIPVEFTDSVYGTTSAAYTYQLTTSSTYMFLDTYSSTTPYIVWAIISSETAAVTIKITDIGSQTVSLSDTFNTETTTTASSATVTAPEINTQYTPIYCVTNRICLSAISDLISNPDNLVLTITATHFKVTSEYLYLESSTSTTFTETLSITDNYANQYAFSIDVAISSPLLISPVPSQWYSDSTNSIDNQLIVYYESTLITNYETPIIITPYSSSYLSFSSSSITGTALDSYNGILHVIYIEKLTPKTYGYMYFSYAYLACPSLPSNSSPFQATYGVLFTSGSFFADSQGAYDYSISSTDSSIKIEEFRGIITWPSPTSSISVTVSISDKRCSVRSLSYQITVSGGNVGTITLPSADTFLLYYHTTFSAQAATSLSSISSVTISPNDITAASSGSNINLSDTYVNYQTSKSFTLTATDGTNSCSADFYVTIYIPPSPAIQSSLWPSDYYCLTGSTYTLDVSKYVTYYINPYEGSLGVYPQINMPFTINNMLLTWPNPSGSQSFGIIACVNLEFCIPQTLATIACHNLQIIIPSTANLYAHVKFTLSVTATDNSNSISISGLTSLYLTGENPPDMTVDSSTGVISWTPSDYYAGKTISVIVSANYTANSAVYTDTKTIALTINAHSLLTLQTNSIPATETSCFVTTSNISQDCELTDSLDTILGINSSQRQPYTLLTSPTDSSYSITSDNKVKWGRSSETTTAPSKAITVVVTDTLGAVIYLTPFQFFPNYQPIISSLSLTSFESSAQVENAYLNSYWERSFTITDGPLTYPGSLPISSLVISNDWSEVIYNDNGVLKWTPINSALVGKYVKITLTYTDTRTPPSIVSKSYSIDVYSNTPPSMAQSIPNSDLICIIDELYRLNLQNYIVDSDSNDWGFQLVSPTTLSMQVTGSVFSWTPTADLIGTFVAVNITFWDIPSYGFNSRIINFNVQPKLCLILTNSIADFQKYFRAQVQICSGSTYFKISWLKFELTSPDLPSDFNIDQNYGDIIWLSPNSALSFNVKVSYINSNLFYDNSITQTFQITIRPTSIYPQFGSSIPIADSIKTANSGSLWSLDVTCWHPLEGVSITVSTNKMAYSVSGSAISCSSTGCSSATLNWTPTDTDLDSGLVVLSCTTETSSITTTYAFILAPIYRTRTTPKCTGATLSLTEYSNYNYQMIWTDQDALFHDITIYETSPSGLANFTLYKWGYFEWHPVEPHSDFQMGLTIQDNYTTGNCYLTLNFGFDYQEPWITNAINAKYCDGDQPSPCAIDVSLPIAGNVKTYSINDTNNFINYATSKATWGPSIVLPYVYIEYSGFGYHGTNAKTTTMLCQGVQCRLWPVILYIDSPSVGTLCTKSGDSLTCQVFSPASQLILNILGYNFGNIPPSVWVGNKDCSVITSTDTTISCTIPMPTFGYAQNLLIIVKRNDKDYTGSPKKWFNYYQSAQPILYPPAISPIYMYPDDDSNIIVPLWANFILPICTCQAVGGGSTLYGIFSFQGTYSECSFSSSVFVANTDYNIQLCCSSCSSQNYLIQIADINLNIDSNSNFGHNHGLYDVTTTMTFGGTYTVSNIIYKLGNRYFSFSSLNSVSQSEFTFQMPPYSETSSNPFLRVSLNHGLTFSSDSQSKIFTFVGRCTLGQYIDGNNCVACPAGSKCTSVFSSATIYYFSPEVCDLGYFQANTGQSSCTICPRGQQCYCRGMVASVNCDAGFMCAAAGTVKRYKPCVDGSWCDAAITNETESFYQNDMPTEMNPIKCDKQSYCLYGVYSHVIDTTDLYKAQPCADGYTCDIGSKNKYGILMCQSGYFCIDTSGTITDPDLLKLDLSNCYGAFCPCPKGYFCPSTTERKPTMCNLGYYQDKIAQASCDPCPAGYYCPQSTSSPPSATVLCPKGYKCPALSSKYIACVVGTYQDQAGESDCALCPIGAYINQIAQTSCKICDKGYICPVTGISTNKVDCPIGYYCVAGTNHMENGCDPTFISKSTDTLVYPNACDEGYYCPKNSYNAKPCGVRTYNGDTCKAACVSCPNGYMCSEAGMSAPTPCPAGYTCVTFTQALCPPGYYCLTKTETTDPTSSLENRPLPCAAGHYCVGGNTWGVYLPSDDNSASVCSIGQFMNHTAASSCYTCPGGYECQSNALTEPSLCPGGTYRPEGLTPINCVQCAEGTYNNNTGSSDPGDCINCPAGIVCTSSGISWLNSSNTEECSGGYYCPAGTSRGTKNSNRCSEGYYCFSGTKSYEESLNNVCPAGRYCAAGTAATEEAYEKCQTSSDCSIGVACTPGYYCPYGVTTMQKCPVGTTSSSGAISIKKCYRDTSNFYDVSILKTADAYPVYTIEPNTYQEFILNYTSYYNGAVVPVDLQQTTIITPVDSSGRRLSDDKSTRVLIISHQNYGTKQSIPINNVEEYVLNGDRTLVLGIHSNIRAEVKFELEFLDGEYNSKSSWITTDTSVSTMNQISSVTYSAGFLCVITRNIGSLMSDPINLYKIFQLNSSYKPVDTYMNWENRFYLTLITNDAENADWVKNSTSQYSYSIWDNLTVSSYPTSYIPYVTDCYPRYGSTLSIVNLINDQMCTKVANPVPVDLYGFFTEVVGDSCSYKLSCDYGLDLSNLNRQARWYEAETAKNNAKGSSKQKYPPFYITRQMVSSDDIPSLTDLSSNNTDLIPIRVSWELGGTAWVAGDVPSSIRLELGYYLKGRHSKEILVGSMIFSDFIAGKSFTDNTVYSFTFKFSALSWIDTFDYNGFAANEYVWLLFLATLGVLSSISVLLLLPSLIWCPASRKNRGIIYIKQQILNSLAGFAVIAAPLSIEMFGLWSFFVWGGVLNYELGSFQDKIPITNSDDDRITTYQAGRLGTCFILLGLALVKWGTDFLVPPNIQTGFSYQEEIQKYKEVEELSRRQGQIVGYTVLTAIIGVILVSISDSPVFQNYYFLILPALKIVEYLFGLMALRSVKEQLYSMPIRLGMKISIYTMMLGLDKLSEMIIAFVIIFVMRILEESIFVKYHHMYILSFISKGFEKSSELRPKDKRSRRKYINAIAEVGDKCMNIMNSWIFPYSVLFIYAFYQFTAYSMIQIHYLYFFIFVMFFAALEPVIQILINYLRILSDRTYFCPDIHEYADVNFRQRMSTWSLSLIKIHDESLDLSKQVEKLFCTGFSGQLYIILAIFSLGIFMFTIGLKFISFNSFSPFLDYWMFLYGLFAYVTSFILKTFVHQLGTRFVWKISKLNRLYQKDARGEIIRSREDYIQDRFMKASLDNNLKEEYTDQEIGIGETSEEIIKLIKDCSNRSLISYKIGERMNKFDFINRVDKERIFGSFMRRADAFSSAFLRDRINNVSDPVYKISLITAQRLKENKSLPKFPVELVYDWKQADDYSNQEILT